MSETLEANSLISHYRIVSKIGAGGMGEVFLANDTKLDRKVAIKFLNQEFSKDADKLNRFIQEAKAASALNHPNILTIHEVGEHDGTNYIVTELIDGKTLREHLSPKETLQLNQILKIGVQVAEALSAAHTAGIVHRDIKPENIMIRKDGYAKVLDFGLAKLSGPQSSPPAGGGVASASDDGVAGGGRSEDATRVQVNTTPGMVMGTVSYMSPEQARGNPTDARTDIWSLGIVLYEMLAGKAPFSGETVNHTIVSILEKEPLQLENVTGELQRIVRKSLTKDVDMRYQSARDLLIDLKNLRRELDIQGELERSTVPNREQTNMPAENATQMLSGVGESTISGQNAATQNVATSSSSLEYAVTQAKSHKLVTAVVAVMLVAVIAAVGYFGFLSKGGAKQINSIAVMPFENRNSDADTDYLSDGLAESVIFRLTQIPDLRVSPTSSVMRYKGASTDIAKIASELGVDAVMTGRLTKRGDNLNITVELVDARTNKSLWGEVYERKLSELLTTQREIVTEIVGKLQLKLSGESEQKLAKKYTNNDEAYQLYLRGQYHLAKRSKDDIYKAIDYYEQSIKLDPNFALAYAGLSYAYQLGNGSSFFSFSMEEGLKRAKDAAVRAAEIDPNLAEARTVIGISLSKELKWPEAEREYRKALEIDPKNAGSHYQYGIFLQYFGRTGDSTREIKTAVELDPQSLIMQANLAGAYLFDRQSELGLDLAKKAFDLDPNFISGRFWLAYAYCANKKYAETIELIDKAPSDEVSQRILARFRGYAYAKSGRRSEAESILAKYSSDPTFSDSSNAATIYGALGDKDKAFAALEKGFAAKEQLSRIKVDPLFDDLRDDPRFKDLLKRMGLPE